MKEEEIYLKLYVTNFVFLSNLIFINLEIFLQIP